MMRLLDWIRQPPTAEIVGLILLLIAAACVVLSLAGHGWAAMVLVLGYRTVLVLLGLAALYLLIGYVRHGR